MFTNRIAILLCLLIPVFSFSQNVVEGTVKDHKSGEPISFATIYLEKSQLSFVSDSSGAFSIPIQYLPDSVSFSFVGYVTQKRWVNVVEKNLEIELKTAVFDIQEITVYSGENPANAIIKNIISHKNENDKDQLDSYSYEVYTKIEVDADEFSEEMKNKKIMAPFNQLLHNPDTTADGRPVIPLILSETISDYYHIRNPKSFKEIVLANKISGLRNQSAAQFSGNRYSEYNIYNNFFLVGTVSFISPLANNALFFYHYFIVDSAKNDSEFIYKLKFKPRRAGENTFFGFLSVDMKTFAITDITVSLSEKSNINFIKDFTTHQHFELVDGKHYMLSSEELIIYFKIQENSLGFFARKTASYENFKVNDDSIYNVFKNKNDILVDEDAIQKNDAYWEENRQIPLDEHEENIYKAIDSLEHNRRFLFYKNLIMTLSTGYLVTGNFEIGPYYDFYSHNNLEGTRLRFGGRTSNHFSTSLMIYGYGAYGLADEKIKYNGGMLYIVHKNPLCYFKIDVLNDFENNGDHFDEDVSDNLFGAFRRNVSLKIVKLNAVKFSFMKEWNSGFSNKIHLVRKTITPFFDYGYMAPGEIFQLHNEPVNVSEITYSIRYAYHEKFYSGEFLRESIGSKYPIVELKYTSGLKGVLESDFEYQKLELSIEGDIILHPVGELEFTITTGKVFGTLPFFLLDAASGNETFYYQFNSFSGVNRYTFISDQFVQLVLSQELNGFPFSRIPGIRKLKWRSLVDFKIYYGTMNADNKLANLGNTFTIPDQLPYMEIDFGIRNIFHIFRLDIFRPLTYRNLPNIPSFGLRGSLEFQL